MMRCHAGHADVMRIPILVLLAALAGTAAPGLAQAGAQEPDGSGDLLQLRAAFHVHSRFSTGNESLEAIAARAVEHGLDVIVVSDDDLLRVDYGLPFLRDLAKVTQKENAVFSHSTVAEYLAEIRRVDELFSDLILIDAVESAPFYYWAMEEGGAWSVRHWNKHMLAVDLRTEEAYEGLPVLGSDSIWEWRWQSLALLWPVAGLLYAFWLGRSLHGRVVRYAIAAVSVVCLANSAVVGFKVPSMDPYHGDLGPVPYQRFIDYVEEQGGLSFWAHPEAASTIPPRSFLNGLLRVTSRTDPHAADLVATRDYTGFASLYADHITATEPGGEWDRVLTEYLSGSRRRPVWGTGDIDYHVDEEGGRIHDISTVFLVRSRERSQVMRSLRGGHMYAVRGGDDALRLSSFTVSTEAGTAIAGEEIPGYGRAHLSLSLDTFDGTEDEVHVRVIRGDGSGEIRVMDEVSGISPFVLDRVDMDIEAGRRVYYRLLARSATSMLTSNPIFVTGQ